MSSLSRWLPTRRLLSLATLLCLVAVGLPPSTARESDASLLRVSSTQAVGHPRSVVWVLCLGSDARPGQSLVRTVRGGQIERGDIRPRARRPAWPPRRGRSRLG